MNTTYNSIIIGAGVAGSVMARQLAEQGRQKVLVLEQRDHIGGNCYDEKDEDGVLVQPFGPHIFHTDLDLVFQYLSRFTKWYRFDHKVDANVYGKRIPIPFNLNTLHLIMEEEKANDLEEKLIQTYGEGSRISIMELKQNQDPEIKEIADYVYENIFLRYTMKQWGQKPEEISPSVTSRVPVVISHDDRYFKDRYQGVPLEGFTKMFEQLLDHPNITVETGIDSHKVLSFTQEHIYYQGKEFHGRVIYTGAADELFDCCYGRLPYRSLRFQFEHLEQEDFQGTSVVNYTVDQDYTRITEFKHLTGQQVEGTTIMKEYPFAYTADKGQIPYYAILNDENQELYEKYADRAAKIPGLYLLGRLAEYKYYNIDAMVDRAIHMADRFIKGE